MAILKIDGFENIETRKDAYVYGMTNSGSNYKVGFSVPYGGKAIAPIYGYTAYVTSTNIGSYTATVDVSRAIEENGGFAASMKIYNNGSMTMIHPSYDGTKEYAFDQGMNVPINGYATTMSGAPISILTYNSDTQELEDRKTFNLYSGVFKGVKTSNANQFLSDGYYYYCNQAYNRADYAVYRVSEKDNGVDVIRYKTNLASAVTITSAQTYNTTMIQSEGFDWYIRVISTTSSGNTRFDTMYNSFNKTTENIAAGVHNATGAISGTTLARAVRVFGSPDSGFVYTLGYSSNKLAFVMHRSNYPIGANMISGWSGMMTAATSTALPNEYRTGFVAFHVDDSSLGNSTTYPVYVAGYGEDKSLFLLNKTVGDNTKWNDVKFGLFEGGRPESPYIFKKDDKTLIIFYGATFKNEKDELRNMIKVVHYNIDTTEHEEYFIDDRICSIFHFDTAAINVIKQKDQFIIRNSNSLVYIKTQDFKTFTVVDYSYTNQNMVTGSSSAAYVYSLPQLVMGAGFSDKASTNQLEYKMDSAIKLVSGYLNNTRFGGTVWNYNAAAFGAVDESHLIPLPTTVKYPYGRPEIMEYMTIDIVGEKRSDGRLDLSMYMNGEFIRTVTTANISTLDLTKFKLIGPNYGMGLLDDVVVWDKPIPIGETRVITEFPDSDVGEPEWDRVPEELESNSAAINHHYSDYEWAETKKYIQTGETTAKDVYATKPVDMVGYKAAAVQISTIVEKQFTSEPEISVGIGSATNEIISDAFKMTGDPKLPVSIERIFNTDADGKEWTNETASESNIIIAKQS